MLMPKPLLKPAAGLGLLCALCVCHLCCSDLASPINGLKTHDAVLLQVPGCQRAGPAGSGLADSCFSFQFENDLKLEFCVRANCCPDSNRFRLESVVRRDTITIAVTDTAARLCRCICPYLIRAHFRKLPEAHYVVVCNYGDSLYFMQHVYRKN